MRKIFVTGDYTYRREQYQFETASRVEYIFPLYFYIFLARFTSLKIYCDVICLSFLST